MKVVIRSPLNKSKADRTSVPEVRDFKFPGIIVGGGVYLVGKPGKAAGQPAILADKGDKGARRPLGKIISSSKPSVIKR